MEEKKARAMFIRVYRSRVGAENYEGKWATRNEFNKSQASSQKVANQ
jgi:hypothetical protein